MHPSVGCTSEPESAAEPDLQVHVTATSEVVLDPRATVTFGTEPRVHLKARLSVVPFTGVNVIHAKLLENDLQVRHREMAVVRLGNYFISRT